MKPAWLLALAVLRPIYFVYSLSCVLGPVFVTYLLVASLFHQLPAPGLVIEHGVRGLWCIMGALAMYVVVMVYLRKNAGDPNPFQSAFMSWFGTLRWYGNATPGPMAKVGLPSGYLVENPSNYRLTANDMRAILDRLQPGDILLRAYDGYMDGNFIRHSSVCSKSGFTQGWFTHAALYVGALGEAEREQVPAGFRHNAGYFQEGPQMILHSMAKGVHTEDILTWFRCDYLAVLRIKPVLNSIQSVTIPNPGAVTLSATELESEQLQNRLRSGMSVSRDEVIRNARLSALGKIGEPYDFECIETGQFNRFSCAEYVYYCFRSIHDALGLAPQLHAFYPFGNLFRHFCLMGRNTITPDDYYNLARHGHLELIWVDERSKREI